MVSKRMKMLREARKLTQKEVAEALGMPKSTYAHYEDGSNEPKISVLVKLALYYEISVDWLIGNDAQNKASPPENKWEALEQLLDKLSLEEVNEVYSYVKFLYWKKQQEIQGES